MWLCAAKWLRERRWATRASSKSRKYCLNTSCSSTKKARSYKRSSSRESARNIQKQHDSYDSVWKRWGTNFVCHSCFEGRSSAFQCFQCVSATNMEHLEHLKKNKKHIKPIVRYVTRSSLTVLVWCTMVNHVGSSAPGLCREGVSSAVPQSQTSLAPH